MHFESRLFIYKYMRLHITGMLLFNYCWFMTIKFPISIYNSRWLKIRWSNRQAEASCAALFALLVNSHIYGFVRDCLPFTFMDLVTWFKWLSLLHKYALAILWKQGPFMWWLRNSNFSNFLYVWRNFCSTFAFHIVTWNCERYPGITNNFVSHSKVRKVLRHVCIYN